MPIRLTSTMRCMCRGPPIDSITVSVFADIFIELTNTVVVSDGKIQITILILRRGALSRWSSRKESLRVIVRSTILQLELHFCKHCIVYCMDDALEPIETFWGTFIHHCLFGASSFVIIVNFHRCVGWIRMHLMHPGPKKNPGQLSSTATGEWTKEVH